MDVLAKLSSLTRIASFVSLSNIFIVEGVCVLTFRCKNMAMSTTTIIDGCGAGDREKKATEVVASNCQPPKRNENAVYREHLKENPTMRFFLVNNSASNSNTCG